MSSKEPLVKIKFQNSRREIFRNPKEFPIKDNDTVVVEAERGEDLGVAITYPNPKNAGDADRDKLTVLRKANSQDISKNSENLIRQKTAFTFCRQCIQDLRLPMKLVDVEYRLDRKKIIFYFTADDRIDFRELVKMLASEFKTRIEMRQISTREEIRRVGGIGPCGKPVCCYRYIDDFDPISTQLVKEQNLPMNPTKISGLCGKLKCCYRYEHDFYKECLGKYPSYGTRVTFRKQTVVIEKIDIFQQTVALKYENEEIEEIPLKDFDNQYKILT
ncbi:MAG: PSP1 domain-containing protein [Fidelibacterota bacterium]